MFLSLADIYLSRFGQAQKKKKKHWANLANAMYIYLVHEQECLIAGK